ncbi:GNAT family N-acetyltransferase [Streptomyces sp. NPDC001941]|uniref:GNAT family N-acetyltransferase n=1 Tax=Streptomyces sp. NPDC001941 TaxID=3154659 RepID=UPI0033181BE9
MFVRHFATGVPGSAALAEHVLTSGHGTWWTDRPVRPRVVAVTCGGHTLLAGDPDALTPADLAPLAGQCVEAPAPFLPLLRSAFPLLHTRDRMLYVQQAPPLPTRPVRGVSVRRLCPEDGSALAAADSALHRTYATWGGPHALARSGYGWAAFRKGRLLAVASSRFAGSRYEDVACATVTAERRRHLAAACVAGLSADVTARGRSATWSCSRDDRASRLLAWTSGFRLVSEYTHHTTGPRTAHGSIPLHAAA